MISFGSMIRQDDLRSILGTAVIVWSDLDDLIDW